MAYMLEWFKSAQTYCPEHQTYESEQSELPPQIRERIRDVASKASRMDVRPSSSILYNVNGQVMN
jgi:hypothetical protein